MVFNYVQLIPDHQIIRTDLTYSIYSIIKT